MASKLAYFNEFIKITVIIPMTLSFGKNFSME
jgi:hypothetical protein